MLTCPFCQKPAHIKEGEEVVIIAEGGQRTHEIPSNIYTCRTNDPNDPWFDQAIGHTFYVAQE